MVVVIIAGVTLAAYGESVCGAEPEVDGNESRCAMSVGCIAVASGGDWKLPGGVAPIEGGIRQSVGGAAGVAGGVCILLGTPACATATEPSDAAGEVGPVGGAPNLSGLIVPAVCPFTACPFITLELPASKTLLGGVAGPAIDAVGDAAAAGDVLPGTEVAEADIGPEEPAPPARYEAGWLNGLLLAGSGAAGVELAVASGAGPNTRPRPSSRPLTTSGKLLPKMANSGTLIKTISMINARIAMAVDDCIGRMAPSKIPRCATCLGSTFWIGPTGRRIINNHAGPHNANHQAAFMA